MKILITGGAGFIGSHLADKLLAEGIGKSKQEAEKDAAQNALK